jgi:hypothetical protein
MGIRDQRPDADIESVIEDAKHEAFLEPSSHFILNPLSVLEAPRRHVKKSLKKRIRGLMAAYISLATFVDDDEVLAVMEHPEKSAQVYHKVLADMDLYEKEIKDFLRRLAE